MSKIADRVRAYVNDPDVADHYGEWGILRRDQRLLIRKLCNTCDMFERVADELSRTQVWIRVEDRLPESGVHCLISCTVKRFDGTHGQYVCVGYYAEKFKQLAYGVDDDCVAEYNEENDVYYIAEGWYEVIKNWDDYGFVAIDDLVTHWMPLPEAPKGGE